MKSTVGMAVLVSLLAAAPGCGVATQPEEPPGVRLPPGGPAIGDIDEDLVGCWDWYNYRDTRTGAESYRGQLDLYEDGTFEWLAYPWASSEGKGLPAYADEGDWGVRGNVLGLYTKRGPVVQRTISFMNDTLSLDGVRQFTCL